jgi:hypothetical protein
VTVVLLGAVLLVVNMMNTPWPAGPRRRPPSGPGVRIGRAGPAGVPAPAPPRPHPLTAKGAPAVAEKAYTGRSAGNEVHRRDRRQGRQGRRLRVRRQEGRGLDGGRSRRRQLTLQGKTSSLTATVDEKATLGSVTVNGTEWPFAAKGVAAPAGLYQGRGVLKGVAARVGWIVEDERQRSRVSGVNGASRAPPDRPGARAAVTGRRRHA